MTGDAPCGFHDASSLVFVGLAVIGVGLWERRQRREMALPIDTRTPTPWHKVVAYVLWTFILTYAVEFAMREMNGCNA